MTRRDRSTTPGAAGTPGADRRFFFVHASLLSAICFVGFWFTYFGPIATGSYPPAGYALHLHGWSFFAWYLLLPVQAALIATARPAIHRALGRSSAALVAVMVATGILVLTVRVEEAVRTGVPDVWLPYGPLMLAILLLFLGFYVAGIRAAVLRRVASHRRLMMVASAVGLGAAFSRLVMYLSGFHPLSLPAGALGCSLFIVIGIVHDRLRRRRVHRVYWIGLLTMLAVETAVLPQLNPGLVDWMDARMASVGERLGVLYRPDPTVQFR